METHKKIVKAIQDMSGQYSAYAIFADWVMMCSIAIQNQMTFSGSERRKREDLYVATAKRYTEEEQTTFAQMFVWLGDALTEELTDVLGEIYMQLDMGSSHTGQFFTPFHVSEMCARLELKSAIKELETGQKVRLHEPSCGSGGMIIAMCKLLKEAGHNYQKEVEVVAQDLDWRCVYMTYLQLSLIGCKAIVVQGDTLAEPYSKATDQSRILRTPGWMGVLV